MRLIGAASIVFMLATAFAVSGLAPATRAEQNAAVSERELGTRHRDGQAIFRFDTFGDEQLWTDVLRMHEVIPTVDPATALAVGLKVDVDALPDEVVAALLRQTADHWWEEQTRFFDVSRSRAWVMMRRLTHTSHHRGQQMAMLRMLGRALHSNYGPTGDTGGLLQNHAPTIYAYATVHALIDAESRGGAKSPLPYVTGVAITERPGDQRGGSHTLKSL